jgi:sugar (pentulose or hexulose) kinase
LKEYVLGIDIGSSDCKVIIVDKEGTVVGYGTGKLEPFFSLRPGYAEQHPRDWWQKSIQAIRNAMETLDDSPNHIVAMGITTQRRTFVPMDEKGKDLRAGILWLDRRTSYSMAHRLRWVRQYEPEVYKKTYKFLGVQAWLNYMLTGEWRDSKAAQFAAEYQNEDSWEWDEDLLNTADIAVDMLPELCLPGEVLGNVTKEAAKKTGLPEGLPVVAGCGDKQSGTMGAGCFGRDKLMISYGTALALGSTSRKRPDYPLMCEHSAIAYAYDAQLGMSGGFWMGNWFVNEFFSNHAGEKSAALNVLSKEAAKIPPGCQGLLVLPHWWGGRWRQYEPHMEDRGAVIGWTGTHTRAHFFRAVLEGILQETRNYKNLMEQHLETTFTDIRVVGGASESDLVVQMTSDVLNCPVSRIQTSAAEALGAAMAAAKGAGFYKTVEEAVRNMAHITKTFTPNAAHHEIYDRMYRRVYVKLYWAMKELNASVHSMGL